jgi:hypothetical protein
VISRRTAAACLLVATLFGCAGGRATPVKLATATRAPNAAALLQRTCTSCHDLGGLSAYSDYWGEVEWRSMVETMIAYGASLTLEEIAVLSRYLAVEYGTGAKR